MIRSTLAAPNGSRLVLGFMTGTSIDGMDCSLIRTRGTGLDMTVEFIRGVSLDFSLQLKLALRALAEQEPMTAKDISLLTRDFALAHIDCIKRLIDKHFDEDRIALDLDLISIHGQTVFHDAPYISWQLFQPSPVAHEFQVPVVCDLRAADLSCGGNGAPITPLADWIIFRDQSPAAENRAVINLGGFCNVTMVYPGDVSLVRGGDVCAVNQLLDSIARIRLNRPYDENGDAAMAGSVLPELESFFEEKLQEQAQHKRSLGTAHDPTQWLAACSDTPANDVARSACCAVAKVIAKYLGKSFHRFIVAGGGAYNRALMAELQRHCQGVIVQSADDFGIPINQREAIEMAVLGALCQDGVPITLPAVTTVPTTVAPVAGLWAFPTKCKSKYRPPGYQELPSLPSPHAAEVSSISSVVSELALSTSQPMSKQLPPDRSTVKTELRNSNSMNLHTLSVKECIACFNNEDAQVIEAVRGANLTLTILLEAAEPGFLRGGRIVYFGAGTSGRLGVLDASESPPTFQVDPSRVVGIIAGGESSLRKSSEGAEDDAEGALPALQELRLTADDLVVGIAAGGTTPYVLGGLRYLSSLPVRPITAIVTCASVPSKALAESTHVIYLATGPEVITGSTRLKAGTATKLALNIISSTLMIRSGKVYENLMVDMKASNVKLQDRAIRIISTLTGLTREAAFQLLHEAGGSCKLAVIMHRKGVSLEAAEELLSTAGGRLVDF